MSYEFYQGQMSGDLPAWNSLLYSKGGWKKSAHLKDGSPIGVDLVGGFYDAGGESGVAASSICIRADASPPLASSEICLGMAPS